MRLAVLAVIIAGCRGTASPPVVVPPPVTVAMPAMRWVPAQPTYLFASPTLGDAQGTLRDAIALLGAATGHDLDEAVELVSGLLGVDALHAEPLAQIGVDLRASWAVFSEDLSPTLVVRLAAPEKMKAFLEHRRARGLAAQSVIVDGIEVFSAELIAGAKLGWAIAGEWLWLHLALPFARDRGTGWFTASHAPHEPGWSRDWAWAQRAAGAAAGVVGLLDLRGTIANMIGRAPDAVACAKLVGQVGRAALSFDGDAQRFAARLALDVGPTADLRAKILPPPSGWDATAAQAALAAQWNLDLGATRSHLAPCLALAGVPAAMLDEIGVRAARAVLLGFDPDASSGSGAIALDLSDATFLRRQLDRIPLRRTIERARTFGTHKGYAIAIPFSVTIEYILEPTLAMVGLGEGVLARLAAPGSPAPPPILALDIKPPAMSADSWAAAIHALIAQGLGRPGAISKRTAERLLLWREARIAVTAEASELVLTISATRR
jgi:hypothetical protein